MSALFNLSPALTLLGVAALLALLPVIWLYRGQRLGHRGQGMAALASLLVLLTFELTVFGAFTRLSDSGLGCPDWPGCYGQSSPLQAGEAIAQAQALTPDGPVTVKKAWIEMLHRYWASAVGALIALQSLLSFLYAKRWRGEQEGAINNRMTAPPFSPWWTLLAFLWVCLQGAFGALTVTMKLFPAIVTVHLLGAMALLMMLQWQNTHWRLAIGRAQAMRTPALLPWLGLGCLGLLFLQMALGAWVSTNYAVLACTTWPLCDGKLLPEADYAMGFSLWRELGLQANGDFITRPALQAIHLVHRWMALPLIVALVGFMALLRHFDGRAARNLGILLGLQFLTGLSNVVLGWPLLAALLHTAGAALLTLCLVDVISRTLIKTKKQS